jgi:hypothetical protein
MGAFVGAAMLHFCAFLCVKIFSSAGRGIFFGADSLLR